MARDFHDLRERFRRWLCKWLGLRFVGIELVPEYLDACVDRLRQGVLFAEGA